MTLHTPAVEVGEAFTEMQGMNAGNEMRVESRTWGELSWGVYIVDADKKCWCVIGRAMGWVRLVDIHGTEISIPPKDPASPVDVVVLPQDQAVLLLKRVLGGTIIKDDFATARQLLIADRWAVPIMPSTGGKSALNKLRDHMEWFHANQWTKDIAAIGDLAQAHEELHASIAELPMSKPHHHTENPGGAS